MTKICIWRSYASNNSSYFRVVACFASADKAEEAGAAVHEHFEKNPYTPDWADEVDDFEDVSNPEVVVAGAMVAVYHTYTDPTSFDDNLPTQILEQHGGEVGEVQERYGVNLQAFVTLPEGAQGSQMKTELDAFFAQAETGVKAPPWKPANGAERWRYETDQLVWFCAGDSYGLQMKLQWSDSPGKSGPLQSNHSRARPSSLRSASPKQMRFQKSALVFGLVSAGIVRRSRGLRRLASMMPATLRDTMRN